MTRKEKYREKQKAVNDCVQLEDAAYDRWAADKTNGQKWQTYCELKQTTQRLSKEANQLLSA